MMIYKYICPFPCDLETRVHAPTADNAVERLIAAGALRCRNAEYGCRCKRLPFAITAIPEEQLKNCIWISMKEEMRDVRTIGDKHGREERLCR